MPKRLIEAVEENRDRILAAQDFIWQHPETGYKEVKTSEYLATEFQKLGYTLTYAETIPGFYTVVDTGRQGPEVLVLGEMDALLCPEHPDADPVTGAVHCCGHSAQCAALLGVAAALKAPHALDKLCGRVRLCAVPAEELIEIDYRQGLVKEGKIHCLCGKSEFLYRGYFDGVDMALMVHTSQAEQFFTTKGGVGCLLKQVVYKGRAAHAGGNPWDGVNALYAATQGIGAVNALRETFKEEEVIRFHPIITKGGCAVNAIPEQVVLQSYVRGADFEAIETANRRINRALCGAALSLGGNVEIIDQAGYAPLHNDKGLTEVAAAAATLLPQYSFACTDGFGSGSTDMGDLSCVMPSLHAFSAGATGTSHGQDYAVVKPELSCVGAAKWQVCMLHVLLQEEAARAKQIMKECRPKFENKAAFFRYLDSLESHGDRLHYTEQGATVKL